MDIVISLEKFYNTLARLNLDAPVIAELEFFLQSAKRLSNDKI